MGEHMDNLESKREDCELDSEADRKPVKVFQDWGDMME